MTWQPIETAPKMGRFLIYSRLWNTTPKIGLGCHWAMDEDWFHRDGYTAVCDRSNPVRATHWMPLPEPPEDAA